LKSKNEKVKRERSWKKGIDNEQWAIGKIKCKNEKVKRLSLSCTGFLGFLDR
jgi:hypothetical protein